MLESQQKVNTHKQQLDALTSKFLLSLASQKSQEKDRSVITETFKLWRFKVFDNQWKTELLSSITTNTQKKALVMSVSKWRKYIMAAKQNEVSNMYVLRLGCFIC